MFSNLSELTHDSTLCYPSLDSNPPFVDYIQQCQTIIAERRENSNNYNIDPEKIIQANSPFEYRPDNGKVKCGVLLIHGLLDCPFTCREIGAYLQAQGILSRAILLPGHGTRPSDLINITYEDWVKAVRYGVETLRQEVDAVYLLGYSTGSALSIYHAASDPGIAGMILIAPAVKLRAPVDLGAKWHHLVNYFGKDHEWVYHVQEEDYVKYKSIAFNGVMQVAKISQAIREIGAKTQISTPMLMILSHDDETVSSQRAIRYFNAQHHPKNKMLLYVSDDYCNADSRIETRSSVYPQFNIANLSHPAMTFSQENAHYGAHGDYQYASHSDQSYLYGAYNRIQLNINELMFKCGFAKQQSILTYNPDFKAMATKICRFITEDIQPHQL